MKHIKLTLLFCALMSTLFVGYLLAASQEQWEIVIPKTADGVKVRMAGFINENSGVWGGAGDEGMQHYTSDGGKTWTKASTHG
jgi:hypothetical protein